MNSLLIGLILFVSYSAPIEAEVANSPSLPGYGVLCQAADVMNAPEGSAVLYTLPSGASVKLREQPRFAFRNWVMIKPAEWIPLAAICKE